MEGRGAEAAVGLYSQRHSPHDQIHLRAHLRRGPVLRPVSVLHSRRPRLYCLLGCNRAHRARRRERHRDTHREDRVDDSPVLRSAVRVDGSAGRVAFVGLHRLLQAYTSQSPTYTQKGRNLNET